MYGIIQKGVISKICSEYPKRFKDHTIIGGVKDTSYTNENCFVVKTKQKEGEVYKQNTDIKVLLNWKDFSAYQIWYDFASKIRKFPYTIPVEAQKGNKYFENWCILEVYTDKEYTGKYITFLSSADKFRYKTGLDIEGVRLRISWDDCESDVYSFGNLGWDNVWKVGDEIHGEEFSQIGQRLFDLLGFGVDITTLDTLGIYSNYWVAKREIFEQYCEEVLSPAYYFMENELKDEVNREIDYPSQFKRDDIRYTWHTFILERAFTTWLSINNIISTQI